MTSIQILAELRDRFDEILTPEALRFVTDLHDRFGAERHHRLAARAAFRAAVENGRNPGFLPETRQIRDDPSWRVAGAGPGLVDRRVEITGPTDRRMTVNALNSGANVWLADLEDATSPTWANVIGGQLNLRDAIRREIDFVTPEGKSYAVGEETPTIVMRPRGWHLAESRLRYIDRAGFGSTASASLVDFGLYAFHNARELISRGAGPYFYLPKIENHLEARLWDEVFTFTEEALGIDRGSIRATVLIETIPAAFEMDEILFELREHCAGLNAGRWDYLFSIIKTFRGRGATFVLPDRAHLTMTVPFMRAYTELLVQTCHRRGAHAIGGMSAFIPDRRNPEVTARALDAVAADKRREAADGFDGTWVAHPDLISTARAQFDEVLGTRPHQLDRHRDDVKVSADDLLDLRIEGSVTDAGVAANVSIALRYLESWLRGVGAAAIDNLMEDVATAEISRSQLWQWIHQAVVTTEGTRVTRASVEHLLQDSLARYSTPTGRFDEAAEVFRAITLEEHFPSFLTLAPSARHRIEDDVASSEGAAA